MAKDNQDDTGEIDSEADLFRKTVGSLQPVKQDKVHHPKPRQSHIPSQRDQDEKKILENLLSDQYLAEEIQPGDVLSYSVPGLQKNTLRKLRRGEYRREVELDLHGMTTKIARQAVNELLAEADSEGWRCIKIVHGKGLRSSNQGPVLKSRVNTWLRQCAQVLAFCSAPPADGGTGVVYVLLRR
jgi:DNA-nicking Smr family endonuclease